MKVNREKGLLSLEASISLTIFIFLMLFMYSFFVVFETRNEIAHVILQTANSMALDAYENKTLGDSNTVSEIFFKLYGQSADQDGFTDYQQWYDSGTSKDVFLQVIKERFSAYMVGSNADNDTADLLLKKYHVKNGIDGLDFSGSYIEDKKLHINVKYTLQYEFQVFGFDEIDFEQSVCSRLWK